MTNREILEDTHLPLRQLTYAAGAIVGPLLLLSSILSKPWSYIGFVGAILGIFTSINAGVAIYKAGYRSRGIWFACGVTAFCLFFIFLLAYLNFSSLLEELP